MRVLGKVIIVTGAASGMGKAMTELFAAEGARHHSQQHFDRRFKQGASGCRLYGIETCRRRIDQKHSLSLCKRRNPL